MRERPMKDLDRRAMRVDFVRLLDWLLAERGISQRQIVIDIGLSSHTEITRWRSGSSEPRPEIVFRLEKQLDAPPGMLSRTLGYLPLGARPGPDIEDVEVAIKADQILPAFGKEILLTTYRAIRNSGCH